MTTLGADSLIISRSENRNSFSIRLYFFDSSLNFLLKVTLKTFEIIKKKVKKH